MSFESLRILLDARELIAWGGYAALTVTVFTETGLMVGFFLPGDSLLVAAGLLAATGDLNLLVLNLLLIPAAITGDATGYLIGSRIGPALFRRRDSLVFRRRHLVRTRLFYEKHGGRTIVLARFVPIVRTFAPVVAGVTGMNYRRFAAFNVFGGIGWVISLTTTGYLLGRAVPSIDRHIEVVILIVIGISVLPSIVSNIRAAAKRRRLGIMFTETIRELVSELRSMRVEWSSEGAHRAARTLEAALHARTVARLPSGVHVPDFEVRAVAAEDETPRIEITADSSPARAELSEAAYEWSYWEFEEKYRRAVRASTHLLSEPSREHFTTVDDSPFPQAGTRTAIWVLDDTQITLRQIMSEGDGRHRITITVEPPVSQASHLLVDRRVGEIARPEAI